MYGDILFFSWARSKSKATLWSPAVVKMHVPQHCALLQSSFCSLLLAVLLRLLVLL
jgi:hypothetical protein